MRSFSRWVVGLSLLCLLPALLALDGAKEEPKAPEPLRAFSAQSGTNTPAPTASPTATGTPVPPSRPPNPPCPGGVWVSSSFDSGYFDDKLALELMHGSDLIAVCPGERYVREPRGKFSAGPQLASFKSYFDDWSIFQGWPIQDAFEKAYYEYRVVFTAGIANEPGGRRILVITEVLLKTASPQLWGGIFQRDWNEWKTVVPPRFITELYSPNDSLRDAEDRELVQIGPQKYGVLLKIAPWTHGGDFWSAILIAEVDGELKEVFSANLENDDYGMCNPDEPDDLCHAYETDIRFCENNNPEFWPIYLRTVGTDLTDDWPFAKRDATKVETYEFQDGAYSLVSSATPEPTMGAADQLAARSSCGAIPPAIPEPPPAAWVMPMPNSTTGGTDVLSSTDRAAILDNLQRPEVIALRKALDAFASGVKSPFLDESFESFPRGYPSRLPFGVSFAGRFALLAVEPNLIRGVNLHIMPQDGPQKVFLAWMVKPRNTWKLRDMWEAAVPPDMDMRRIAAYKLLLSDPELGF